MHSEKTRQIVLYHVKTRDAATLWKIVKKHTNENDLPTAEERATGKERERYALHTDGWAAYFKFDFDQIKRIHKRHVHGLEGAEVRDFRHSNHAEGMWGEIKTELRRSYISIPGSDNWLDFVFEAIWKINIAD
jgi:hypothetical protein